MKNRMFNLHIARRDVNLDQSSLSPGVVCHALKCHVARTTSTISRVPNNVTLVRNFSLTKPILAVVAPF